MIDDQADAVRFRWVLAYPHSASVLFEDAQIESGDSSREYDRLVREKIDAQLHKKPRSAQGQGQTT